MKTEKFSSRDNKHTTSKSSTKHHILNKRPDSLVFGTNCANIITRLTWEIEKNRKNEPDRFFINKKYWVRRSVKEIAFLCGISPRQVKYAMRFLIARGIFEVGKFDTEWGAQVNWYAYNRGAHTDAIFESLANRGKKFVLKYSFEPPKESQKKNPPKKPKVSKVPPPSPSGTLCTSSTLLGKIINISNIPISPSDPPNLTPSAKEKFKDCVGYWKEESGKNLTKEQQARFLKAAEESKKSPVAILKDLMALRKSPYLWRSTTSIMRVFSIKNALLDEKQKKKLIAESIEATKNSPHLEETMRRAYKMVGVESWSELRDWLYENSLYEKTPGSGFRSASADQDRYTRLSY